MPVTTTPVGVGAAPNDGTGDPARTGGQTLNTNVSNLDAAVEELQSGNWEIDNTSETLVLGEKVICQSHAGITKTLPAVAAIATDDFNDIWVLNVDTNSNVSVDPNGTEEIFYEGATLGSGTVATLEPQTMAVFTYRAAGDWNMYKIFIGDIGINNLSDVTISSVGDGEIMWYVNGSSEWQNATKEEADIVDRLTPAFEATPYIVHRTVSKGSGTETIDITADPSVFVKITGNNVTIDLDTPTLSLPERGLAAVKLEGRVLVLLDGGAHTGLSVTTDAGTTIATFPKGTAPSASGEYATLVWWYFDDGTTDFMWAEWVPEA